MVGTAYAMWRPNKIARCLILLALLVVMSGCQQEPDALKFSGATMGTRYNVTVVNPGKGIDPSQLKKRVETALARVNQQMSTYIDDSELSRINHSEAQSWVPVSASLLALIKRASDFNAKTQGAFDVTVGPLVNLWGFGPEEKTDSVPSDAEITERIKLVGLNNIILRDEPPAVRKRQNGTYIDLSAIAKGYGVDQVAQVLADAGLTRYLVEIGGELSAQGTNTQGKPWQIAVERPSLGSRKIELVVSLQDQGMATSGDYRNFFEAEGKYYSHTIDPRTGRPVTHDLHAVTVLAPATADADALATALLVMGPKDGLAYAKREKIAALFISGTPDAYTEDMTQPFTAHVSNDP